VEVWQEFVKIAGGLQLSYRVGLALDDGFVGVTELLDALGEHVIKAVAHVVGSPVLDG
jgi:hypothetical protein